MATVIKDGRAAYTVEVDSKSRLRTYSVIEDEPTWINRNEGEMYSGMWQTGGTGVTAGTAGNYIVYLKNTSSTKDLIMVKIRHRCENANGTLSFWLNTDGTPGGTLTTLTPGNRNAGSNNEADCIYYQSTEITGLSNGRQVGGIYGIAGQEFEFLEPCSGYILPPNSTFSIKADNDTSAHFGGISFYFRDIF